MASYQNSYNREVSHSGLNKYRLITGYDEYVVRQKAAAQMAQWDEMWERKKARLVAQQIQEEKRTKKLIAADRTDDVRQATASLENTLAHTLSVDDAIDWSTLLDNSPYPGPQSCPPKYYNYPCEPESTDPEFNPPKPWYNFIMPDIHKKAKRKAAARYRAASSEWQQNVQHVDITNQKLRDAWMQQNLSWQLRQEEYLAEQAQRNDSVRTRYAAYLDSDPSAIAEYHDLVLSRSQYPDYFPQEWEIQYLADTKTLLVDYMLPPPEALPKLAKVDYSVKYDELHEIPMKPAEFNRLYDSVLHQICLRTIHEMFESDQIDSLAYIVFNGWVSSVSEASGNLVTACIMSVRAERIQFQAINLASVIPKKCFKSLKGVASSELRGLAAITPILQLNKEDKRFVASYSVTSQIDQSTNLAAMHWEDFEHLIRELFESEFSSNGGEVKVTQASSDGGVDAVAFDPDPIRGGKIVIQAKRYTNTVGISAVRDLYGTIMNEGATKGILVTTSDYGPEAYDFANGKPITLLNGCNLLALLEKHGHRAFIDINAAKAML